MIKHLTSFIIEAIKNNGPISVFWGGIIEQVITPIPSVLIPMSAGFLIIPKDLPLLPLIIRIIRNISIPYSIGATIGSSILYLGSLFGGRVLIEKYGKYFDVSIREIDKFKSKFTRGFKDEVIIFLLVTLPVTPISIVAVSCGLIGITPAEFYPLLLLGTFIRSVFLGILGWKTGKTYETLALGLNKSESLISIGIVGIVFLCLAILYSKRKKFFNNA